MKDDTLYIFGGGQTYVDENKNGRTVGPITVGYSEILSPQIFKEKRPD